jgi:Flp pilus assembly protein TadB
VGTPVGLGCLVAATVLDALGALWMRRMIATAR